MNKVTLLFRGGDKLPEPSKPKKVSWAKKIARIFKKKKKEEFKREEVIILSFKHIDTRFWVESLGLSPVL